MLTKIQKSLSTKIAVFSVLAMSFVLIFGMSTSTYFYSDMNKNTQLKISSALDDSANKQITGISNTIKFNIELLLKPVINNLAVIRSNVELSGQEQVNPDFIVKQFDATMQPQEKDVFSGYMVFEKNTWPKNSPIKLTKAFNKSGNLAPFFFPDGKDGFDYVAMESFSNNKINSNGERTDDWHLKPFETGKLFFMEPYYYDVPGRGKELITTISDVIKVNGQNIGSIGFDLSLIRIQKLTEDMDKILYQGAGRIIVGSWKGIILADSDNAKNVGKRISEVPNTVNWQQAKTAEDNPKLIKVNNRANAFSRINTTTENPWIANISVPVEVLNKDKNEFSTWLTEKSSEALLIGLLAGISALVLGCFAMMLISKKITGTLYILIDRLKDIAHGDGDLTQRISVSSKDQTGRLAGLINHFIDKLQIMITDISMITTEVDKNSIQGKETSHEASSRLDRQTAELNSLTVAAHEMSTTASEVANAALQASKAVQTAQDDCSNGVELATSTTRFIEGLYDSLSEAEIKTNSLSESAANIESILSVIGGIAEQTNLLALNAAIEAARAGEQGRGFAVVADEVRTLAGRTQQSTEEIRKMIELLTGNTKGVVNMMAQSLEKVSSCVGSARSAEDAFKGINSSIDVINMQNTQMAAAAEEQSRVNEEINRTLTIISDMSNEANGIVQNTASLSDELTDKVSDLRTQLNKFKI
ncbi:methyl-accepting chemotaxis protein [Pseudoalteromonas denitrificans]|uniref:Methyl-accepting chemotaxis sensory transducer with Cache sensor n=1 Tax=Pseudoalteromonas denitrificans DSM 6059 TaxID=1123010 RepID=A0A1I1PHQ3_9GAMM|nr:methyl-accepting chemotaxis protein [Pseudoalteromonas denitrificans]SFD09305.1 methyl-accepting chemotaxis sensory transducer with Cache sensor [Pseudoalteromonas denitrificans DSM 6059]